MVEGPSCKNSQDDVFQLIQSCQHWAICIGSRCFYFISIEQASQDPLSEILSNICKAVQVYGRSGLAEIRAEQKSSWVERRSTECLQPLEYVVCFDEVDHGPMQKANTLAKDNVCLGPLGQEMYIISLH